ncbi:isochorismate synthase [Ursidibacter sp. B-7004-1]
MSIFNELKQRFITLLSEPNVHQFNCLSDHLDWIKIEIVVEQLEPVQDSLWLHWLKQQPTFPHFFWQSRSNNLLLASIGAVKTFSQLEYAEQFSQQFGIKLVGGLKFEGQCQFILPRLCLEKNLQKLTACLYLNKQNLAEEIQTCLALLTNVDKVADEKVAKPQIITTNAVNDFEVWQNNIQQAIDNIKQHQFRKVVLANATTFVFNQPLSAYDLLAISQRKNLGCYHFLWAEQASQAFIGSSPERLYKREDRQLRTEALAGTATVTSDLEQTERNRLWLLSDQKNTYENQLVVDDICDHLKDCVSQINVNSAEIKRLHNVQHLRRKIQATLKEQVSDVDCLMRIQPTAAVAGLPRLPAKQFIAKQEGFERGWYAGTLGYFHPQSAEFCVNLRSAKIQQNQITLYAGAGIVEGSDPETEWQEIERKALAMAGLFVA